MVIVKAGNPKGIHSYSDLLHDPSIRLGYLAGGTGISDHIKAACTSVSRTITVPDPASALAGSSPTELTASPAPRPATRRFSIRRTIPRLSELRHSIGPN